jgi:ComF family protein
MMRWADALERFLLPNACVSCERMVERFAPDSLLCRVCVTRLRPLPDGCERCRQPLPPVGPCRFCAHWPRILRRVTSAVWLGAEARAVVHHLKYDGLHALGDLAAEVMARSLRRPAAGLLVPIPLSAGRRRRRGYNQAEAIACGLARRWSLTVEPGILRRVKDTGTQTALTPEERAQNVARAFDAMPAAPAATAAPEAGAGGGGAAIILVDDVLTTGATLGAAARALERRGRTDVVAVTFARALPYELAAGAA